MKALRVLIFKAGLAQITMNHSPHETIEQKARHFVAWQPTSAHRLAQLQAMGTWASHFNPQWKVKDMVTQAVELFAALERQQAHYLVMGGFAAVMYGVPRFTVDVNLFVDDSHENIHRIMAALIELGSAQAETFVQLKSTLVTFIEIDDLPLKTDLMVQTPGLTWEKTWANRQRQTYQEQPFYVISRADLITAKRAVGRWQDLEDVKALEATA